MILFIHQNIQARRCVYPVLHPKTLGDLERILDFSKNRMFPAVKGRIPVLSYWTLSRHLIYLDYSEQRVGAKDN